MSACIRRRLNSCEGIWSQRFLDFLSLKIWMFHPSGGQESGQLQSMSPLFWCSQLFSAGGTQTFWKNFTLDSLIFSQFQTGWALSTAEYFNLDKITHIRLLYCPKGPALYIGLVTDLFWWLFFKWTPKFGASGFLAVDPCSCFGTHSEAKISFVCQSSQATFQSWYVINLIYFYIAPRFTWHEQVFCKLPCSVDCIQHYIYPTMLISFKTQYTQTGNSVVNFKDIFGSIDMQIRFVKLWLNINDKWYFFLQKLDKRFTALRLTKLYRCICTLW